VPACRLYLLRGRTRTMPLRSCPYSAAAARSALALAIESAFPLLTIARSRTLSLQKILCLACAGSSTCSLSCYAMLSRRPRLDPSFLYSHNTATSAAAASLVTHHRDSTVPYRGCHACPTTFRPSGHATASTTPSPFIPVACHVLRGNSLLPRTQLRGCAIVRR
jgi:hypothetical protein